MKRPMVPTNQMELAEKKLGHKIVERHLITEKISIPGIENLHLKSTKEVAEVFTNVLKSKAGISSITYKVGEYIEITSLSDTK